MLTASHPFGGLSEEFKSNLDHSSSRRLWFASSALLPQYWNKRLQERDPELFEAIDDEEHTDSWRQFIGGTTALVMSSFAVNWLFLAWTQIYEASLTVYLGAAIFTGLHYFVGALITSLPEMNVAMEGYSKITRADLNTVLSAASVSNMTNLAIAVLGILLIILLKAMGLELSL